MDLPILHIALILVVMASGIAMIVRSGIRTADDVLADLREGGEQFIGADQQSAITNRLKLILNDDLAGIGLYDARARQEFRLKMRLLPIATAALVLLLKLIISPSNAPGMLMATVVLGLALGYIISQSRFRARHEAFKRKIDFYLPVVMERLVMAVHAGLDVIAAIRVILEHEEAQARIAVESGQVAQGEELDPVSRLMEIALRLTEAGLPFDQALKEVANSVHSPALRHAFVHLGLAYKEGGELVMPLRELSDSTQLYFQESAEEEIAKLPVKATLPLVCTFAGLILLFLTSPMIQILQMTSKALPK